MSIVEQTMRSQRDAWREISDRVSKTSAREFPMEPPKRILLFGLGSSHFAARLTAYALLRDKLRRVPVVACSSIAIGNDVHPQKGDWVFAFSHRGNSEVTIKALELCERLGALTVLVCGKNQASASRPPEFARYILETVDVEKVEPHTAAVTGAICAVTTLLLGEKAVEEWDAVCSIGDPDIDTVRKRAGMGPKMILGEFEGEWLAREGALKIMEMARTPVQALSTEEFYHGPRFALAKGDVVWHVSVPRDPRNGEIKAPLTIGVFGASPLAWIPALVELQWLALGVALNRGIDPDLMI